jgi:integrase
MIKNSTRPGAELLTPKKRTPERRPAVPWLETYRGNGDASRGHNIKTVQARLGHASPAITLSLYVHPDEEQDTAAANHLGDLLGKA